MWRGEHASEHSRIQLCVQSTALLHSSREDIEVTRRVVQVQNDYDDAELAYATRAQYRSFNTYGSDSVLNRKLQTYDRVH